MISRILLAATLSAFAFQASAATCEIQVLFPFGSSKIPAEYADVLANVVNARKSGDVKIVAHTDLVGTPASNQALSDARAAAVAKAMVSAGLDPARIKVEKGVGEADPVEATTGPSQANRRADVVIGDCNTAVIGPLAGLTAGEIAAATLLGVLTIAILTGGGDNNGGSSTTTTTTATTTAAQ